MSRRQARESSLQVIYALEMGSEDVEKVFQHVFEEFATGSKAQSFARKLVKGVLEHKEELDAVIKRLSKDWDINRLAVIDRNIMRIALYEMLYIEDIPDAVSVNEAVELAKMFGGKESAKFVNGILGRVVQSPEIYKPQSQTEQSLPVR